MPDFVRVSDPDTGAHITVTAQRADDLGLKPLKTEACDRFGNPLPAKPRVDLRADGAEDTTEGTAPTKEK